MNIPMNFDIKPAGEISGKFLELNLKSFTEAVQFVEQLPYRRNTDKNNLSTVFTDGCGTCSTKHALLKQLADENTFKGLQLVLCIFRMNGMNTPKVAVTLDKYGLDYIPEAHNYLKYLGEICDHTGPGFDPATYRSDILLEIEIQPSQITDFKVAYHKDFLKTWLAGNPSVPYSPDELWVIREQCIGDLAR